ncbi:hypothetical protein QVZ41_08720 [Wenyingzhuangia sp. chi5]|uniref:Uncharacterized protein n=2 Tax=Wenyingzhuangia gilva TaxID=3057677 RepID=A0ABT8VSG3_9FLAO|nr:hypothetical protein [Wenyingzhuangia sp. chi5]
MFLTFKRLKYIILVFIGCSCMACEYITEIEDISTKTVTILAPSNETVLDTLPVTFTWQALEGSEQYHLQVATPNFNNAARIVVDTVMSKTNYTQTLSKNSYEWRVQGKNAGYVTDYTTQKFSIEK